MESPSDTKSWVVVWTESRAEKQVESRLAASGIEAWLPKFVARRRWSDRWRDVVLPLFPGYLFARGGEPFQMRELFGIKDRQQVRQLGTLEVLQEFLFLAGRDGVPVILLRHRDQHLVDERVAEP